jgi:hypothetical protein
MRHMYVLIGFTALAACGGGSGPQTVGGSAVPGQGGSGTGGNGSQHTFVTPTETKTYSAIGGAQSFRYSTDDQSGNPSVGVQFNQLYAGDASTARNSGISITYNPRDAIFDLTIAAPLANTSQTIRFQDPLHRTDFGGAVGPQGGVPDYSSNGVRYLEVGSGTGNLTYVDGNTTFPAGEAASSRNVSTFFYQEPGTTTRYVTFAGFVRNQTSIQAITTENGDNYLQQNNVLERAAFAFGERTQNNAVPTSGSASYTGDMIATMVYNPLVDSDATAPTYFQWINGTATVGVNFSTSAVTTDFTGTVGAPGLDIYTSKVFDMPAGSTFTATGTANVNLVNAGGFIGQIDSASFVKPGGAVANVNIAGSSVDGAFFGPAADEVGGGFRIVGGTPDERIDILGTFTGAK